MTVIWEIICMVLGIYLDEKNSYSVSGSGLHAKVDKKATKAYYESTEGNRIYQETLRHLELEILLLSYVFKQDDGLITHDESVLIKKHLRPHLVLLQKADIKRLKRFVKESIQIRVITKFISLNAVTNAEIARAFGVLDIVNQVTGRHNKIIEQLKTEITSSIVAMM